MIKCDTRARQLCPFKNQCCGDETAYFEEESECDKFNQMVCDVASADVVSRAAYDKVLWELDTALKQIRDDYGIGLGEKKVDMVHVVRCGQCKNWKPSGSEAGDTIDNMGPIGGCGYVNFCRKASDFCSYGEPKEGAD